MEQDRKASGIKIRADVMSVAKFTTLFIGAIIILFLAMILGWAGPEQLLDSPIDNGTGLDMKLASTACTSDPSGASITPIPNCFQGTYTFSSRLQQYFSLRMLTQEKEEMISEDLSTKLALRVTWMGQTEELPGVWLGLYNSTVLRQIECEEDEIQCSDVTVFSTSSVQYKSYFYRVQFDANNFPRANVWMDKTTFALRVRNIGYSKFELGFQYVWFIVSLALLFSFFCISGKRIDKSKLSQRCGVCKICFRQGVKKGLMTFQRQEGTNWLYFMVIFLVFWNQPFLGATYNSPRPQEARFFGLFCQFNFVCLLLMYWLVEFGLLKANQNTDGNISCCRFYAPKIFAIFVYWITAISALGAVVYATAEDPLYDWTLSGTPKFAVVWAALAATFYLLYLLWVLMRSFSVIKTFQAAERFLFGTHLTVLIITVLGIAAGAATGQQATGPFAFIFFNTLFNLYVILLVYLYTPVSGDVSSSNDHNALADASTPGGGMHSEAVDLGQIDDGTLTTAAAVVAPVISKAPTTTAAAKAPSTASVAKPAPRNVTAVEDVGIEFSMPGEAVVAAPAPVPVAAAKQTAARVAAAAKAPATLAAAPATFVDFGMPSSNDKQQQQQASNDPFEESFGEDSMSFSAPAPAPAPVAKKVPAPAPAPVAAPVPVVAAAPTVEATFDAVWDETVAASASTAAPVVTATTNNAAAAPTANADFLFEDDAAGQEWK